MAGRGRSTVAAAVGVIVAAAVAGLFIGQLRLEAIDGQALRIAPGGSVGKAPSAGKGAGREVTLSGFVEAEPSRSRGVIRFRFRTGEGRLMVESPDPGGDSLPGAGDGLVIRGLIGSAPAWYRPVMKRHGLRLLLRARQLAPSGDRRGGLTGLLDRIRSKAETALGRGAPAREAALARGFVLGQDAAIDPATTADFRASGLSHLLAVSGQNVVLLGLLAWPLLALMGVGLSTRRLLVALLILIYVPLAGGGASIQRAGVMGIAALAAVGAGRASSRLWTVALAAALTLGLDPRAGLDPGWQLSFAAVIGIALLAAPLRVRLEGLIGAEGWRRALAEGAAVTLAASIATAPLIAFHFGRLPVATVAANLAVLPAVAPAMWLGMIAAGLGQIWSGLALPFNLANSAVLAMIARTAAWFGRPAWAEVEIQLGPAGLAAAVGLLVGGCLLMFRFWRPPSEDQSGRGRLRHRLAALAALVAVAIFLPVAGWLGGGDGRRSLGPPPDGGVRIDLLDVGQGDAILIRPSGSSPTLIDGGPPDGDLPGALRSAGVDRLAAVLLTHRHLDHFGGLYDLFPGVRVDSFLFDQAPGSLIRAARAAGTRTIRAEAGRRLRLGSGVQLELLWPSPGLPQSAGEDDPNARSVGALLGWGDFRMYLPGDGEAEAVPVDPGPLDVLKVAHHGSSDTGLDRLLTHDRPRVAVIEVGADNGYGHPAAETIRSLATAGAATYRTDRDGTVSILVDRRGYRIETGR